ncbi:MAG: hypothetical protein DMF86_05205, partial [Acidobacteria bacterium]
PFVEGESAYFLSINRNKESLTLDLKHPAARRVVDALLARADVVVENFRPGTMERLGLGYDAVAARHPRVVYCSISGFGQTGPRRAEAGYDAVMQGEGGLMSITGPADGEPFRLGVAIADIATGMFAAQAALAALLARERTGRGQRVDIAMLDTVAALLTYQAGSFFATGETPRRMGNRHPAIAPYETFEAGDGPFVLAVGNDDQFRRMCDALGIATLRACASSRCAEVGTRRGIHRASTRGDHRDVDAGGRAVRGRARRRRNARRSATDGARDDRDAAARRRRQRPGPRDAAEAVRHAGVAALGASGAGSTHRPDSPERLRAERTRDR